MNTKAQILDLSRQNNIGPLSPWFDQRLDMAIEDDTFLDEFDLETVRDKIIEQLSAYREETGKSVVVLGMSGGVDSALTAALFKAAGWRVLGVTMPIHQVQAETDRGLEACLALGIEHFHIDLTTLYDATLNNLGSVFASSTGQTAVDLPIAEIIDPADPQAKAIKIRRGNVRARLRMITLYNFASLHNGIVASTDNFSELTAGFWTLHGDVGDVSPIQSLLKSWEVPYLSKLMGVPESTYRATPTDGLGIDAGDEAQLGASYLEWDLMVLAINETAQHWATLGEIRRAMALDARAEIVFNNVTSRIKGSWFKRMNPVNMQHPFSDRYAIAENIDKNFFHPPVVIGSEFMIPGLAGVCERNR